MVVSTNLAKINYLITRTYQWKTCTRHQSTSGSKTTALLVVNHWLAFTQSSLSDLSSVSCLHRKQLKTKLKWMVIYFIFLCLSEPAVFVVITVAIATAAANSIKAFQVIIIIMTMNIYIEQIPYEYVQMRVTNKYDTN